MEFFVEPMDTPGLVECIAGQAPDNPFCTHAYFTFKRRTGAEAWIAVAKHSDGVRSGAGVFIRRGRLNTALEIVSLPTDASFEQYWSELIKFGAKHGVTRIEADTYGSPALTVPMLPNETERRERCEYVVKLQEFNPARISSNHRRNIRRAASAGITIAPTKELQACREHLRLVQLSQERRRQRGEAIISKSALDHYINLIETGCGELFQALGQNNQVLSSVLILRSAKGGYYESAGTSPEGMVMGASQFLIHGILGHLKSEGLETFNLGGAPAESTLARFKSGFGAATVLSTAVSLYVGSSWRKKLTAAVDLAHSDPKALVLTLTGKVDVLRIYSRDTTANLSSISVPGAELVPLSAADLGSLNVGDPLLRQRQLDRLARFGKSYAYAVMVEGKVVHIAWLLPPEALTLESPIVLRPDERHAEITGCETPPQYRGMGAYGFAIKELCSVARQQGLVRIYMKTHWNNKPSQRGIRKAGLKFAGFALLLRPPLSSIRMRVLRLYR